MLSARLVILQYYRHATYAWGAFCQQACAVALEEYPRGRITDREGRALAGGREERRVAFFGVLLPERGLVARQLSQVLDRPVEEVSRWLRGEAGVLPYALTPAQEAAIKSLGLPGLFTVPYRARYTYPPLAVHVVGYLGKVAFPEERRRGGSDWVGRLGCECLYDSLLQSGFPALAAGVYHDACGRPLGSGQLHFLLLDDRFRGEVQLTLDAGVQRRVEAILDSQPFQGAVVVLEARKGDILAVASRPAFDPEHPERQGMDVSFFDRAFAPYPPGSVFKLLVVAAALEEGIVRPEERWLCRGEKGPLIPCWKKEGHGWLTLRQALAQSCNPVVAQVGQRLGLDKLISYYRAFAFDDRSVIGYPLPPDPRQRVERLAEPFSLVNLCVGQGPLLLTPVQVAAMVNALVNDGVYVRPRLVKRLKQRGVWRELSPDPGRRLFSSEVATELQGMMVEAVREGTARQAQLPGVGSGGKTGTAELGGGRLCSWFAGFFPVQEPRYVVVVMKEGGKGGGEDAAPLFRAIATALLDN
ncbi:peptidoglycan D,D-transpeptidase FtsI family protein [Desulfothermobacter acidiphilus]|uniref:peptidoglycan D,D-transpeptidase FtsI family protein n=1 Tax=Desulfothermobacter acidiphilus TaxID=1938353 RepID=UPI003F8ACF49